MNKTDAVSGALVADAAAMGLHWMYDQEHIGRVAQSGDIVFRAPDAAVYDGQKSYFAHAGRQSGQSSHYGAAVQLYADLLGSGDDYSIVSHRDLFLQRFGPGGTFVGYADRPTKALVARMLIEQDDLEDASGADDDQLPALASVPAFFAHDGSHENLERAIRVVSNNQVAVDGAFAVMHCLELLQKGEDMAVALKQSAVDCPGELGKLLSEALTISDYDPLAAAQHFGLPCHLPQGLPVVWHMLNHGRSFETMVRDNVACGGDSCGRAMALGPIAGFKLGIPEEYRKRTTVLKS